MNPISLSFPFPLVLHVHVRVRANSGFDRGVGVRGRGRYPLKPRLLASLLETKGYPEHTGPDHPESIFSLNHFVTSGAGPRAVGTERGRWSE